MRVPTLVLFVLLALEFVVGCASCGYIIDIGIHWHAWQGFGALSLWVVLFLSIFGPTFNAIMNRDAL